MVNFENIATFFKNIFKRELAVLWLFSLLAGFALIILQNKNKLPLGTGDFVFIVILALLVALYKPRWIFFLFVSAVPLENIILAGGSLPVQLRPYQVLVGILIIAVAILYISKKLYFKIRKPIWIDWLLFSLVPFGFLALLNAPEKNITFKQILVLFSYVAIYFLIQNLIRTRDDLKKTAFFFFGSWIAATAYGFFQVFADKLGRQSFEVMFGRPNSTFAEPDWLGIFLCFSLAVFLAAVSFINKKPYLTYWAYLFIFLDLTLLILTLSRSAWIGAAAVIILYLLFSLHKKEANGLKLSLENFAGRLMAVAIIISVSLIVVHFGKLSKFDLSDRARSAATSEQKITIACESGSNIPPIVSSTDELSKYNCRHINLEEIADYQSQGQIVTEIFRKDPNILTRSAIYQKSWNIIREHPILGVGFGTITRKLGADERGAGLNESNIFFQVWAGCGVLGLIVFIAVIGYLFTYAFRRISPVCPLNKIFGCPVVKDDFEKNLHIFTILAIFSLIIPNLFNAGLLMGLFWLVSAVIVSDKQMIK